MTALIGEPQCGFYLIRMVRGGPFVPVVIYRPCAIEMEPDYWNFLDRSPRQVEALRGGEKVEIDRVWPYCFRWPITAGEYLYRMKVRDWAIKHAPDAPESNPLRRIDPLTTPLPF